MKTVKPSYYDNFKCIADKCPYTCCREWDISVDKKTALAWRQLEIPGEKQLLSTSIRYGKGENLLKLNCDRKCGLLNENGLCRVVLEYGENCIPETCHVFPREEILFSNRTEKALSPACPYVLDLLWKEKVYSLIEEAEGISSEIQLPDSDDNNSGDSSPQETAAFMVRDWFMQLLKVRSESAGKMLRVLFCILRDMREAIRNDDDLFTPQFVENYKTATNIPEVFAALASETEPDSALEERFRENNELFLDIVNRYVKQKKYTDVLKDTVPFAEFLSSGDYSGIKDIIPLWKLCLEENERLLRLLVWEETGSSLVSAGNPEAMLVKLEWIILEYVSAGHAIFLRWFENKSISYEKIRESVAVICRITGYNENEIRQFLKTEFESLIWPVDYAFLVI